MPTVFVRLFCASNLSFFVGTNHQTPPHEPLPLPFAMYLHPSGHPFVHAWVRRCVCVCVHVRFRGCLCVEMGSQNSRIYPLESRIYLAAYTRVCRAKPHIPPHILVYAAFFGPHILGYMRLLAAYTHFGPSQNRQKWRKWGS